MAIVIFWATICASIALTIAAFQRLRREHHLTIYDFLIIPVPFLLWLVFVIVGWKEKTLSNLVELLVLAILVPVALSLRTYVFGYRTNLQRSKFAFWLCVAVATLLYTLLPALSE